jgi:hypothetical protein
VRTLNAITRTSVAYTWKLLIEPPVSALRMQMYV